MNKFERWCDRCATKQRSANQCDGCSAMMDLNTLSYDKPPTKFKPFDEETKIPAWNLWVCEHELNMDDSDERSKHMIITIIGSMGCKEDMMDCKDFWERFGHTVNCPYDEELEKLPLLTIQSTWINKIKEADLIVAINKELYLCDQGKSEYVMKFGESTTYEMALALDLEKEIVFW